MTIDYSKSSLSFDKQIVLLRKRGMSFHDPSSAKAILKRINYYRLRGYWITFEQSDCQKHLFKDGTRFEDVLNLYFFDEQLRQLLLMHLGKIEISLKSIFSYYLSHVAGPLSYREKELFKNTKNSRRCNIFWKIIQRNAKGWDHATSLRELDKTFSESPELFAEKLKEKYLHPPIWAIVEVMTFGEIVRWYKAVEMRYVREKIAKIHGIPSFPVFARFIHSASALRNACAHHNRIVHRILMISPRKPNEHLRIACGWMVKDVKTGERKDRRVYNLLALLNHVLKISQGRSDLRAGLEELSNKHNVSLRVLGFPADWQSFPVWADPQQ